MTSITAEVMARDSLCDRLRGIYRIPVNDGAGKLNGSDEFTRQFETPPIQHEAAAEIERLRGEVESLREDAWKYRELSK